MSFFPGTHHGIVHDFVNFVNNLGINGGQTDQIIRSTGCKGLRSNQILDSRELLEKKDGKNPLSYHCDGILNCVDGSDEGSRICRNHRTDASEADDGITLPVSF